MVLLCIVTMKYVKKFFFFFLKIFLFKKNEFLLFDSNIDF